MSSVTHIQSSHELQKRHNCLMKTYYGTIAQATSQIIQYPSLYKKYNLSVTIDKTRDQLACSDSLLSSPTASKLPKWQAFNLK